MVNGATAAAATTPATLVVEDTTEKKIGKGVRRISFDSSVNGDKMQ